MEMEKKTNKKKIVAIALTATLAVSALAASFAWLTDGDQVVNELKTDGRLDTSIVELFDPPSELSPGQNVQKEVSVANNGDVDAFVRVKLTEAIETNVESAVATAGTSDALCYTDDEIAAYTITVDNGDVVPSTITVKMNSEKGYIAYVTATKQKVNLEGIAITYDDQGNAIATVTGTYGITYATLTTSTETGTTFTTATPITSLTAGQTFGGITLTAADVEVLSRYANSSVDNLYLTCLSDGTPIVLVLDEDWTSNFDYNDGYFYYKRILSVGATTENLLDSVVLLPQSTNDYANATYDITVDHESIQASVDAIKDVWGATVAGSTATIGSATVDTTGAIEAEI